MENSQASFADSLGRAHRVLLDDLQELQESACSSPGGDSSGLTARLAETFKHITEHFRFEEENGYLDTVRKREPRFERIIQQLAGEHRQLTDSLGKLIDQAEGSSKRDARLRSAVRDWIERVRHHEIREDDLVQDAFNLDISGED